MWQNMMPVAARVTDNDSNSKQQNSIHQHISPSFDHTIKQIVRILFTLFSREMYHKVVYQSDTSEPVPIWPGQHLEWEYGYKTKCLDGQPTHVTGAGWVVASGGMQHSGRGQWYSI